jgi:hypothetical protein
MYFASHQRHSNLQLNGVLPGMAHSYDMYNQEENSRIAFFEVNKAHTRRPASVVHR